MFRKDGYTNWRQLEELTAFEVTLADLKKSGNNPAAVRHSFQALRAAWVHAQVVKHCQSAFLIDENGTVTALDAFAAFRRRREIPSWKEVSSIENQAEIIECIVKLRTAWCFVDSSLGFLDVPSRLSQKWESFDYQSKKIGKVLRRFTGQTIAFSPTEVINLIEEAVEDFGADIALKLLEAAVPKKDTPSGLTHAYQCLIEAFPNGKGSATWDEVVTRTGYSRRTIVRAMKKFSGRQ
jgi:hypothetical protein